MNLFMHSVRLVLNDWRTALRVTGILYLIYALPSLLITFFFPTPTRPEEALAGMAAAAPLMLVITVLAIVVFVWIAVTWHRYILLNELPEGQLPPFNQSRMLAYGGWTLAIGFIAGLAALVLGSIVGILLIILPFLGFIAAIAAMTAALILGYRLSPILPAAAIGRPLTIGEAWQSTAGASVDIIILAVISAIAAWAIDIPAYIVGMAGAPGALLATVWVLATGWVKMMVGISIITTLYGVFVEKRALPN
ncbi:MAG: hypothetical protein ACO1OG_04575 [Devosia sp.]